MKFPLPRAAVQQGLLWLSLCFSLYAGTSAPSLGGIVEPSGEFDHLATGFPLIGRHQLLSCETCHRDGEFKGLPKLCSGCHDGKFARGKNINHIPTLEQCNACHSLQGFTIGAVMDHSVTTLPCSACHNNLLASGQSTFHLKTSNNCAGCHGTSTWVPVLRFDHTETDQPCVTCHNSRLATGKSPLHPETTDDCAKCHRTLAFRPAFVVNHQGLKETVIICANSGCHDGITHSGKLSNHIRSTNECGACHSKDLGQWTPPVKVDHAQIPNTKGRCRDCHLSIPGSSTQGLIASDRKSVV